MMPVVLDCLMVNDWAAFPISPWPEVKCPLDGRLLAIAEDNGVANVDKNKMLTPQRAVLPPVFRMTPPDAYPTPY